MSSRRWVLRVGAGAAAIGGVGVLCTRGALTLDLGVGRRTRRLGPIELRIAAPREVVFDVIEGPYRRTPRAMAGKLRVWERAADMMGEHLRSKKIAPDIVLCSPAVRARQTLEGLGMDWDARIEPVLYGASEGDLASVRERCYSTWEIQLRKTESKIRPLARERF